MVPRHSTVSSPRARGILGVPFLSLAMSLRDNRDFRLCFLALDLGSLFGEDCMIGNPERESELVGEEGAECKIQTMFLLVELSALVLPILSSLT